MPPTSDKSKQHPEWMNKLFPIAFSLAGLALLIFGSQELFDGYSSRTWKTTQGLVIESRLADKGHSSKSKRKNYEPVIVYTYTVDRDSFTSDRILFGISSFGTMLKSGEVRSRELLKKYPQGSQIQVAYDPTDPGQSTLNKGAHLTAWVAPAMGLPFLAVGLLMFRPKKKRNKAEMATAMNPSD